MKSTDRRFVSPLLAGLVVLFGAITAPAGVVVVNMIPKANSGETNQDSEPNLAVNPINPLLMAGSAFTPDPNGGPNAPIFVSKNGGHSWLMNTIVPSLPGRATGDITVRFSESMNLYAGILRIPGGLRLNILRTNNFLGPSVMTVLLDRTGFGVRWFYRPAHGRIHESRLRHGQRLCVFLDVIACDGCGNVILRPRGI